MKVYPYWFNTTVEEMIESGHMVKVAGQNGLVNHEVSKKGREEKKKVMDLLYHCKLWYDQKFVAMLVSPIQSNLEFTISFIYSWVENRG